MLPASTGVTPISCVHLIAEHQESFRGEGGYDFFEARVAAQRVPKRQQLQLAITDSADRKADDLRKLFAGESSITDRCCDSNKAYHYARAVLCIFFHGKQLNRLAPFS